LPSPPRRLVAVKLGAVPLKILCAGCPKDEREAVEAVVRKALGTASTEGAWSVSLVRLGAQWQVTLDAPPGRVRSRNLMTKGPDLAKALADALEPAAESDGPPPTPIAGVPALPPPSAKAPGAAPATPATPAKPEGPPRVACEKCRQSFVVIYDAQPDEGLERVPVACPHCWSLNQVLVGAEAAANTDYRAEKA
jgi:hypothetical protein